MITASSNDNQYSVQYASIILSPLNFVAAAAAAAAAAAGDE